MPRVAIDHLCGDLEMLETELIDHIEKGKHREEIRALPDIKAYREYLSKNFTIEERTIGPYEQPWLRNVRSLGIETRMRHN